jgi:hypothetical protein
MKKLTILLALVMIAGCAMSATESVTLSASRTGERVMLTLRNGSAVTVGYNLCSSGLQRGPAWEPVETGEICTMEIRQLQPGDSATFEKTLPPDLAAGEYRYTTNVYPGAVTTAVTSNPFRVE